MLIIGDGPGAVAVRKERSSGRIACAGMTVAQRSSGRPRGRAGEVYGVIVGSLVLISGNSEKSRSRVSRASTPCAAHIAAIRASWIMPPTTRGRCANRLRVSRKSSVLANQSDGRRSSPRGKLPPSLLRRRGVVPPYSAVGHDAQELVAAWPRYRPDGLSLGQRSEDCRRRFVVARFAPMRVDQDVRVYRVHRSSLSP